MTSTILVTLLKIHPVQKHAPEYKSLFAELHANTPVKDTDPKPTSKIEMA